MRLSIKDKYFNWICELIDHNECDDKLSYIKLLHYLDSVNFYYFIDMDANRANDGISLRYRFGYEMGYSKDLIESKLDIRPCSVLEMMVALSVKCENIMEQPDENDRTGLWFWNMIDNLGLGDMTDYAFDEDYVREMIDIFLEREYSYNGEGGLFTVKNPKTNMRDVEIWSQMMWYLDEYLNLK